MQKLNKYLIIKKILKVQNIDLTYLAYFVQNFISVYVFNMQNPWSIIHTYDNNIFIAVNH